MAKGNSNVVSHPKVSDIDAFGSHLSTTEKIEWVKKTIGMSDNEAKEAVSIMESYSGGGYHDIHYGINKHGEEVIDKVINNPKAPVFTGKQFRGMCITPGSLKNMGINKTPKEYVEAILSSGVYKDLGVSSFSQSKATAMSGSFGNFKSKSPGKVSVLITYHGGTKGMPFKHISNLSSENEVLHSSTTMKKGLKITGFHWNKKGNECFIEVDD